MARKIIASDTSRRRSQSRMSRQYRVSPPMLPHMLMAGSYPALVEAIEGNGSPVPGALSRWRPQGDSNPCYRRERAVS